MERGEKPRRSAVRRNLIGLALGGAVVAAASGVAIETLLQPHQPQLLLYDDTRPEPASCHIPLVFPEQKIPSSDVGKIEVFHQLSTTSDLLYATEAKIIGIDNHAIFVRVSGNLAIKNEEAQASDPNFPTWLQTQELEGVTVGFEIGEDKLKTIKVGDKVSFAQVNLSASESAPEQDKQTASYNLAEYQKLGDEVVHGCTQTPIFKPSTLMFLSIP
jgi:hypothetical protein